MGREPDRTLPSSERQAELEAQYAANLAAGNPPYAKVEIRTRGEMDWVCAQRHWTGKTYLRYRFSAGQTTEEASLEYIRTVPPGYQRPDLREVVLQETILGDVDLIGANLSGANLNVANFSEAYLARANLSGTLLLATNFRNAQLPGVNLSRAEFSADVSGANLSNADLSGANLLGIICSVETTLSDTHFDEQTLVRGAIWNGVPLDGAVARNIYPFVLGRRRLGDELAIKQARTRQERITAYRGAQRAYHGLYVTLRDQGLMEAASPHRLREQRLRRRELFERRNLFGWFFYLLLDIVAGYGEKPARTLLWYVAIIVGFAVPFAVFNHAGLSLTAVLSSLTDSVLSFHGRGLAANSPSINGATSALSAAEAIIGLFIEISFIATFVQRYFNR